jgi:hypothetical protein
MRVRYLARIAIALWIGGVAVPSTALAGAPAIQPESLADKARNLKPGEFLWLPQIAPEGPVVVVVSVATQRAIVYRNGVPIGIATISTGKDGHETPTGVFTILQKKVEHVSNLYDAPMPYMQRLTWGGIALHAGNLPGYPASHGCIRLPIDFARKLYGVTTLGITVVVTDDAALPRLAPVPELVGKTPPRGSAAGSSWTPELAPTGPVSVVVSAADKRVVVLRNGKEIGSAPVEVGAEVSGTSAYTFRGLGPNGPEWLQLPVPGSPSATEQVGYRGKIVVDDRFRQAVLAVLRPGATVILTADSLSKGATGRDLRFELAEPHQ